MPKQNPLGEGGGGSTSGIGRGSGGTRPALSMAEEVKAARKMGASESQAKSIAKKRMEDPKAFPGAEELAKVKEWYKTAKPGESYTTGKGPSGTQPGHAVTSVNRKTGKPN